MAPSSQRRRDQEAETERRRRFAQAAWEQRGCAVTLDQRDYLPVGPKGKNWEAHHVVEKSWLKRHGFGPSIIWDPRNSLRVRPDVHRRHTNRSKPIPIACLLPQNIEFAFEVMGPTADEYLHRMYSGDPDPRVKRAFTLAEETMEKEIAALPPGVLWVPPHLRSHA
jgi:hypothetical protein